MRRSQASKLEAVLKNGELRMVNKDDIFGKHTYEYKIGDKRIEYSTNNPFELINMVCKTERLT